jgi:hypothetical protein
MSTNGVQEQREKQLGGCTGKGFMPGQSGNPGGRRKGKSLTTILREKLEQIDEKTGKTNAELLVESWFNEARAGNTPALKEALDRTEGKVPDKVEIDDLRKAYVTENPETLWPSEPEVSSLPDSEPMSLLALPEPSGETPDPSSC